MRHPIASVSKSWKKLKILKAAYPNMIEKKFWQLVFSQDECSNILILLEIYLALSLSTVDYEQVSSRMNLINPLGAENENIFLVRFFEMSD